MFYTQKSQKPPLAFFFVQILDIFIILTDMWRSDRFNFVPND